MRAVSDTSPLNYLVLIGQTDLLLPADPVLDRLHAGERAAILLAERLGADIVLLDEKAARTIAVGRGLRVSGLLGVLRGNGPGDNEPHFLTVMVILGVLSGRSLHPMN